MNPLLRAGMVLGVGLGGFFDEIVLHQILGWHHLICVTAHCQPQTIAQLQQQNRQDGCFHLAMWGITLAGVGMLFQAANNAETWSARLLGGSILTGWGTFHLVEGIIDHHILGIHHVRPGHPEQFFFDMLFLATGLALVVAGAILCRRVRTA